MPACPVSSLDPFADDFLAAPYPFYSELREAGPVVRLERYGLWACARHAEVQAALSDWETFSSAAGVGIDDFRRTKPWRPPSLILEADPPLHTRSRTVMNRALSAKPMAGLRAGFKEAAEKLADELVARRRADAIADIAEAYPLSVFPKAIGLGPEGVENLLPYGAMVFNAFGPRNAHFEAVMAEAAKLDQHPVRSRGAVACRTRRDHLGCGRHRRDHSGGGAAVGALAALGRTRHHDCRHRQRALRFRHQPGAVAGAAREASAGTAGLRRGAALGVADPDVLPHHHPHGRHWRDRNPARYEGIAIPGLR